LQLAPGVEVGGYRIREPLGRGGMGVVYRAEHPRLQTVVALKILSAELAQDETFRSRFVLESQLASSLHHPNIIPVYDAGEAEGQLYLAMRIVDGPSLRTVIAQERPLDAGRALALLGQVASALDAAHAAGLVHRDVKPENILVTTGGATEFGEHAYLTDFGVSKHLASGAGLTQTGQLVGTLHYVGPEQIEGKPVDGRCDQYALGCVLFECLTGKAPFVRESDATLLWAHLNDAPPKVTATRPDLPIAIDAVLARMLAKAPKDRYASCREAFTAARAALTRTAPQAKHARDPRRAAAALAAVGVAAGIGGVVLLLSNGSSSPAKPVTPDGVSHALTAGKAQPLTLISRAVSSPERRKPQPKPAVRRPTPSRTVAPTTTRAPSRPTTTRNKPTAPPPVPPLPP
jgi:serine/threonine-protein kinase